MNLKIQFKFTPSNKLSREYMAVGYIIDILQLYEFDLKEVAYYLDGRPNFLRYLFNTHVDHFVFNAH